VRGFLVAILAIGCDGQVAARDSGDPLGDDGVSACPAGQWCVETAPVAGTLLHAVWAVDPGVVFAVGSGGVILERRAGTWTRMTSGTPEDLLGVWAASATDAWAVGDRGTVLRYDGQTWSPQAGATGTISAVLGFATTDVYLATTGAVLHWDGLTFTSQSIPGTPFSLAGIAPTDVWLTGESSKVSHFTGAWTTGIDPGAGSTYFAIHQLAAADVWVGAATGPRHFDGTTWTPRTAGLTAGTVFQGFRGIAADDVWAAGGNRVGHWDGAAWTLEQPGGASAQLFGIHGAGSSVWVVGSDSLILHRN
jgi:hypothetical protein